MKKIFLLTATCVVVTLPWSAQAWIQFLDGSTLPDVPWQSFQDMSGTGAGDTLVVDFLDPALNVTNQALRLNSGSGANEWYVGAFFDDEVVGAARFRIVSFSPTGKENLLSLTTRSLSPAPSLTLVDGRFKLWTYVLADAEIMDLGPVDTNQWHTVYLWARYDGKVKLWWDGRLVFDGAAPVVNPYDAYMEWGSGSWEFDATDTVDFDWVGWGDARDLPIYVTTVPAHGTPFHDATSGFNLGIVSVNGVASNAVAIAVNGVDRTGDLLITGDNTNRQGSLGGLLSNRFYEVVLRVTDLATNVSNYTIDFQTFSQTNFMFEAEDWNFDGGQFLDKVVLSSTAGPDNYVERADVDGIDQNELTTGTSQHQYRSASLVGTENASDFLRQKYLDAQGGDPAVADYEVGWVEMGEWLNYTRTFPAGNYAMYGRLSSGISGPFEASVATVTGASTTSQTTTPLGSFKGAVGHGWQHHDFIPLTDAQTNLVTVSLNGLETLRVTATSTNAYNANFYMLVPVPAAAPTLSIARSSGNVIVSWTGTGFTLESTDRLGASWGPVSNPTNPLTVTPSNGAQFYRLRQ